MNDDGYIKDGSYYRVIRARTKAALPYIKAGQLTLIQISKAGKYKEIGALPKGCWQVILGAKIRKDFKL